MTMTALEATALDTNETEAANQQDSGFLLMDAQTLKDLEVFDSSSGGTTLFDLCNHTRSRSGGAALRARMLKPFSNPARIRSVQRSLGLLTEHRRLFDDLPGYVITHSVERYMQLTLPPLLGDNFLDFGVQVINIVFTDTRRYDAITQGVGVTTNLIKSLHEIVMAPELLGVRDCELADMLEEIRSLLGQLQLTGTSGNRVWESSAWNILRDDQIYRYHEKYAVARLLQLTFELDALLSLADTTHRLGFVMPEIAEGPLAVSAEALTHPLVPDAVANPFHLDQKHRLLFLTGPNMAGKTTYLRSVAVAYYFAHLGMGVSARSFRFVPAQVLFSSISLSDDLHHGVSFFQAEGLRVKAIAQALAQGLEVFALMDEPFKGTNVKDALDASRAVMERFAATRNSLFMFSSHLIELSDYLGSLEQVICRYFEAREDTGTLEFGYVLHSGVSSQRLGMRVLQEQGIFELLDSYLAGR